VKRIVVLCFVLVLQGLNLFGQTNAVPPMGRSVPRPESQQQTPAPKPKPAGGPSGGILSHETEITPAQIAAFKRIKEEGLLTRRGPVHDYGAELESIFRSKNDQMGDTIVRDPVVLIFPTGQ
jgi:hypothetical protein